MKLVFVLAVLTSFCMGCVRDFECIENDVSCEGSWIRLCHLDNNGIRGQSTYWEDNTNCADFGATCKEGISGYRNDPFGDFEVISPHAACVVENAGCAAGKDSVCEADYIFECSPEHPYGVLTYDSVFWKDYGGRNICVEVEELGTTAYAYQEGTCVKDSQICAPDGRYNGRGYFTCYDYGWISESACEEGTTCTQFSQQSIECVRP